MSANPVPGGLTADGVVEQKLRSYFRTQMPERFPALALDEALPAPAPMQSSLLWRGRVVLAVCVAVLLVGLWYLLEQNGGSRPRPALSSNGLEATKRPLLPAPSTTKADPAIAK